jgi:hypothetical protein
VKRLQHEAVHPPLAPAAAGLPVQRQAAVHHLHALASPLCRRGCAPRRKKGRSMTATTKPNAADVHAAAALWFRQQMETARVKQGARWHEHNAWVADYLRETIRLRLIARGWRRT